MAAATQVRVREAGPEDADAVTDLMLVAMEGDRDWWDYRYRKRHQHPDDHRKFMRLLVEAWLSPGFDDWVVVVAEVRDQPAAGHHRLASFSVWDTTYLSFRRHGPGYVPPRRRAPLPACLLPGGLTFFRPQLVRSSSRPGRRAAETPTTPT